EFVGGGMERKRRMGWSRNVGGRPTYSIPATTAVSPTSSTAAICLQLGCKLSEMLLQEAFEIGAVKQYSNAC
ncbi:hypothetical protein Tco_1434269, partial [Tanacetum coccineum]